ncbi:MAG: ATP-binding protein [Planctomycetaceae bacterium]|nr:ATP-binding protein [Planctomycetaceae bacterium]
MKQRIEIRNFGPIKHVDLDIADYTLFIGPNASGKSTIAKLVYFFQSPLTVESIDRIRKHGTFEVNVHDLKESFTSQFQWLWDIQAIQNDFKVNYYQEFDEHKLDHAITLKKDNGRLDVTLTDGYLQYIRDTLMKTAGVYEFPSTRKQLRFNTIQFLSSLDERLPFLSTEEPKKRRAIFIPAGRQILSLPTDSFPLFKEEGRIEPLVEEFMKLVKRQKNNFHQFIQDEFSKFEQSELKHEPEDTNWGLLENLKMAIRFSDTILKGKYINTREGERIYFNEKQFVKLYEASSGQQESLWIVNLIYLLLWETCSSFTYSTFTIIEEPEAHLFPETQKDVTELISLLANGQNQVMITTHSPYILSALNNLLYAHKVGNANEGDKREEVAKVIDPLLWVDIDRVAAYKLENGTIRDIIDRRTPDNPDGLDMIIPEEIDSLPHDPIVEDYTKLFHLDDCNDAD